MMGWGSLPNKFFSVNTNIAYSLPVVFVQRFVVTVYCQIAFCEVILPVYGYIDIFVLFYDLIIQQKLKKKGIIMKNINIAEYRDKVLGCWTGKNIGGTLGAPFEGKTEMQEVSFYTQDLAGKPEPNDDLDLQLIWLIAAEKHGLYNLNENLIGEYWLEHITGPWAEYGVCKLNIEKGLYPPLSGSCNNNVWKYSNGAWIRSEIWACLFPGEPDSVLEFAYLDACADHCGEGIYAELFTASIESAAFVVNDIREIINIGLKKIPEDCRVARSIKIAINGYEGKKTWQDTRQDVVKDSEDLGWFQAPANVAFTVIGLLYGEGDFDKTVCTAVNCGDDTDCTGATAGAVMGILMGRSKLPQKWIDPIGDSIQTIAINPIGTCIPKTLTELTDRTIYLAKTIQQERPELLSTTDSSTEISEEHISSLSSSDYAKEHIWARSPYELSFSLPFGVLRIDYENGPSVKVGECKKMTINFESFVISGKSVDLKWILPEEWQMTPAREVTIGCVHYLKNKLSVEITPAEISESFCYVPLDVRLNGRSNPITLNVPLQIESAIELTRKPKGNIGRTYDAFIRQVKRHEYAGKQ
jgi:ADP-ribosylglycohydrolase